MGLSGDFFWIKGICGWGVHETSKKGLYGVQREANVFFPSYQYPQLGTSCLEIFCLLKPLVGEGR